MTDDAPPNAAVFFESFEENTSVCRASDPLPWPPPTWLLVSDCELAPGKEFCWDAPPEGFGLEQARDWVEGVVRMMEYQIEVVGFPLGCNSERRSALNNAYMMAKDWRKSDCG